MNRNARRAKVPTIDYRDRPRTNRRLLAGAFFGGALAGAVAMHVLAPGAAPAPPVAVAPPPVRAPEPAVDRVADYKANELPNALQRQSAALKACYDIYLQDEPDLAEGKVTIDFQIDPDGTVSSPGIVKTELDDHALSDCLVARVAGFAFPPPPDRKKTYASHTFVFQKERGL